VLLEKQLHSALDELASAKLIIKLEKERNDFTHDDRTSEVNNSPRDTSAMVHPNSLESNEWSVITAKSRKKGFPPKNPSEANNTYPLSTANRYKQLANLQDMLAKDRSLKTQEGNNTSDIPNCNHQTKLQHQSRERNQRTRKDSQKYHIPTLLNGRIENKGMETELSAVAYKNSVTKNK
jgi:hypothetical protein